MVAGTNYRVGLDLGGDVWRAVVYEPLETDTDAGGLELLSSEQVE